MIAVTISMLVASSGAHAVVVFMQDFESGLGANERTFSEWDTGSGFAATNNWGLHDKDTNLPINDGNLSGNVMGHIGNDNGGTGTQNYRPLETSYYEISIALSLFQQDNRQLMFDYDSWIRINNVDDGFNVVAYTGNPLPTTGSPESWLEPEDEVAINLELLDPTGASQMQYDRDLGSAGNFTRLDDVSGFRDADGLDAFTGQDPSDMTGVAMFDLSTYEHDVFNLRFSFGTGTASTAEGINLDNVKITGDCISGSGPTCDPPGGGVPEPASFALVALGLTALYRRRRHST